ncbi:hypothetical protein [Acaryochloris sp. IP29b_bin.148]|uniref:hypothetical protein n=1 Tax=Acaryochloris sp. IP29b_bin.148 TaxID=2969218 RepID=UPI00260AC0B5|nr:hypothetical protein [Acaryochloris sp. IP29b_bin.148]
MNQNQIESNKIINMMRQHIRTYIEQPNVVFGDMPICPFSAKAHQGNKVNYIVYDFQLSESLDIDSGLLDVIKEFSGNESSEVLIVIHPDKQALSLEEMVKFMQGLNKIIDSFGLIAFSGHPLDEFNIKGVFTRRDPYISFTVQDRNTLESFSKKLKNTVYYDNWTLENLNSLQFSNSL